MSFKTSNKGFSLIELMVVISIIGILSVISITALNSARNNARKSNALSTASGVTAALVLCSDNARSVSATEGMKSPVAGTYTGETNNTPDAQDICNESSVVSDTWPEMPERWVYGLSGHVQANNPDTWYFTVKNQDYDGSGNKEYIYCDSDGCKDCTKQDCSGDPLPQ